MSDRNNLESVERAIGEIDLGPIRFKLVKEYGISVEMTHQQEKWYKRFLLLAFKYPDQPIVVSKEIDNFWHQHILDTRKYAEDCERVFGGFLLNCIQN